MHKLKPIIATLIKYQFWGLVGLAAVVSLVCWWWATSGLAGQFQQRKSKLDGDFKSVVIQPDHPNQNLIDSINKLHEQLQDNVSTAWEVLYKEQKEKNPFPTAVLGEDFKERFERLGPQEELAWHYRERYQNFIKEYLPKLQETINALRPVESVEDMGKKPAAGGVQPGGVGPRPGRYGPEMYPGMTGQPFGAEEVQWEGVVEWNENDYARLLTRFEWEQVPSTIAVLMAQEDLWVYEALLRVIKNTNEGATNPGNAAVKKIEALLIGREAAHAWKASETALLGGATGGAAPGGMPGLPGGMPGAPGGMPGLPGGAPPPTTPPMGEAPGLGAPSGSPTEDQTQRELRELFDGRYVDDKGQPLVFQSQYPYAQHPYAEFKMMPVCMHLVIDQRRLPQLLVECANSNMPIEVRRVRLLKTQTTSGGGSVTAPGGMFPRTPSMPSTPYSPGVPGYGPGMRPEGYGFGRSLPGQAPGEEPGQFDMPVEIHAMIYIYNPPDREKLGTGAAGKKAEETPPASAPSPAATPPPLW